MKGYTDCILYAEDHYYIISLYTKETYIKSLNLKQYNECNICDISNNTVICEELFNNKLYNVAKYIYENNIYQLFSPHKLYCPESGRAGFDENNHYSPISGILQSIQLIEYNGNLYYARFQKTYDMNLYSKKRSITVNKDDSRNIIEDMLDIIENSGDLDSFLPIYSVLISEAQVFYIMD